MELRILPTALACSLASIFSATAQTPGANSALFGVTMGISGTNTIVQINPPNGQATAPLFSFPLSFEPAHMSYYPPTAQFVFCTSATDLPRLAFVDPATHVVTEVPVTNLPPGIAQVEAVAYFAPSNSLAVTCGPVGFTQEHLALVDLTGGMTLTSQKLPFDDADYVVFNPVSNQLYIVDMNNVTGVQAVTDPFGASLAFSTIAPSPLSANFGGPTMTPDGQLLVVDDPNQALVRLVSGSFQTVGPFNAAGHITSLAYAQTTVQFKPVAASGSSFTTSLNGLFPGQTVVLQTSTNLQDWSPLQTNTVTGFVLGITNNINPSIPAWFLRAQIQ